MSVSDNDYKSGNTGFQSINAILGGTVYVDSTTDGGDVNIGSGSSTATDVTIGNTVGASSLTLQTGTGGLKVGSTLLGAKVLFDAVDTAPTLTAAQLLNGYIYGAPTADRAYVTPTAAQIVAAYPNATVGDQFEFTIVNNSTTTDATITLTAGTGVDLVSQALHYAIESTDTTAATEPPVNSTGSFLAVLQNVTGGAEDVDIFAL